MLGVIEMKEQSTSMPIHAPAFPDPFVPYECPDYVSLYAVVEMDEAEVRRILSYTDFEYVSNQAVISITDFSNCNKIPYMDSAIVIPIKYGNKYGGYYIYEYENNDAAIAAGRELWGYPKKYADISLIEKDGIYSGEVKKDGKVFLEIKSTHSNDIAEMEEPQVTPHLNIRTILHPGGDDPIRQIIERDTSPDFVLKEKFNVNVELKMTSTQFEPLDQLKPLKILCGGVVKGDFYATKKNGWGKVISEL